MLVLDVVLEKRNLVICWMIMIVCQRLAEDNEFVVLDVELLYYSNNEKQSRSSLDDPVLSLGLFDVSNIGSNVDPTVDIYEVVSY